MGFLLIQEIENAQEVGGEIVELQGPFVVVRVAVAARIPRNRPVRGRKCFELKLPVLPVAADAVQEKQQRAAAGDAQRDARRAGDEERFQGYSALAPDILTARARLSLSLRM